MISRLPWTKFQDFYLRLGFLKVLVGVLSPDRRSASNDSIVRRLQRPLFDAASMHPRLWERVQRQMYWYEEKEVSDARGRKPKHAAVAEALLVDGDCHSLLFAITGPTAYKMLDWARDIEFIGRANQITERGLLLKHLLPQNSVERFFGGDVEAWNPFVLSVREKALLYYHLIEIDEVILELISDLSRRGAETTLESRDAAELTCSAVIRVLSRARNTVSPLNLVQYRTASDLAATIAAELGMEAQAQELIAANRPKAPKPARFAKFGDKAQARKTTKNADHQTIPRFEQLVDLGFIRKPPSAETEGHAVEAGRRRWRYVPTEACSRWAASNWSSWKGRGPARWSVFARSILSTLCGRENMAAPEPATIAGYLWRAYESIKRPAGLNPLDSVALFAMLSALEDGLAIELADFHWLMLRIKQRNLLPHFVSFASGNELDEMFIQLKPGFCEELERQQSELIAEEAR